MALASARLSACVTTSFRTDPSQTATPVAPVDVRVLKSLPGESEVHALVALMELRAAIAACYMRAGTAEETDWDRIVLLYDALLEITTSPIVALNRAVAVGMAWGPAAGLEALDAAVTFARSSTFAGYHLFPSVRGDLLMKLGRLSEAREEIRRAISMTKNLRERELLANRLKQWKTAAPSE